MCWEGYNVINFYAMCDDATLHTKLMKLYFGKIIYFYSIKITNREKKFISYFEGNF